MNHVGSRRFFPSGSYSCTYPLAIEHVGTVEKGRYSDRERGQGQPNEKASLEKVEKDGRRQDE